MKNFFVSIILLTAVALLINLGLEGGILTPLPCSSESPPAEDILMTIVTVLVFSAILTIFYGDE